MADLKILESKRVEKVYDIKLPWYIWSTPLDDRGDQTWYVRVDEKSGSLRLTTLVEHHYDGGFEIKIEEIGTKPLDENKLGQDMGNHYPTGDPEEMFHRVLVSIQNKTKELGR